MTNEEIARITERLYHQFKNVPGIDRSFIQKCLISIVSSADREMEEKINVFARLL